MQEHRGMATAQLPLNVKKRFSSSKKGTWGTWWDVFGKDCLDSRTCVLQSLSGVVWKPATSADTSLLCCENGTCRPRRL